MAAYLGGFSVPAVVGHGYPAELCASFLQRQEEERNFSRFVPRAAVDHAACKSERNYEVSAGSAESTDNVEQKAVRLDPRSRAQSTSSKTGCQQAVLQANQPQLIDQFAGGTLELGDAGGGGAGGGGVIDDGGGDTVAGAMNVSVRGGVGQPVGQFTGPGGQDRRQWLVQLVSCRVTSSAEPINT